MIYKDQIVKPDSKVNIIVIIIFWVRKGVLDILHGIKLLAGIYTEFLVEYSCNGGKKRVLKGLYIDMILEKLLE